MQILGAVAASHICFVISEHAFLKSSMPQTMTYEKSSRKPSNHIVQGVHFNVLHFKSMYNSTGSKLAGSVSCRLL